VGRGTINTWLRRARLAVLGACAVFVLIAAILVWLWRDRPSVDNVAWPSPPVPGDNTGAVTATWLGVTTLLFDDGETQILIDGFFSRPSLFDVLLDRPVDNDAPMVNYALDEFRMRQLAAIIPVHSHYDHAMDVGAVARRSSASVLGSESSANIARGAGVIEDQVVVVSPGEAYEFGNFRVRLLPSGHAPVGWRGSIRFPGTIDEPLEMPQPVSAFREGGSYTVVIEHPEGTTIIQGSAAFREGQLDDIDADVVMLGVGGVGTLGKDYVEKYWQSLVTSTGAHAVYPIHFDDFTKPFGEIVPIPRFLGDFEETAGWLETLRDQWDKDTRLYVPKFGEPIALYEPPLPAT
jgi:L-ascorbate metabolism protein UlaG (beta-lactamase superfamily)